MSPAGERCTSPGFTVVELLVVLLILCSVTLGAMQVVGSRPPQPGLEATASLVAAALREGRGLAIRDNRETPVRLDLDERLLQVGAAGRSIPISAEIGLSVFTATSQIREGSATIAFFPDGTSTGGRVRLCVDQIAQDVVIDWLTGRVDVRR